MRWERILGWLILAALMSGCDVVRAGVFIATVPHYHGGEAGAVSQAALGSEAQAEPAPATLPPRVPPGVSQDPDE